MRRAVYIRPSQQQFLNLRFARAQPAGTRTLIAAWMPPSVLVNPPSANASVPSRTPADFSAHMADGGPGDAVTTDSCPERAAAEGDLRDHAVRLVTRRTGHCLC
jgi:hypothetical protein